jgi:hypothetical protein
MMFDNATRQELEVLNRLRHAEFTPLLDMLHTAERETAGRLAKADDPHKIYRLQGAVATLQDFIRAVEQAPEQLHRMTSGSGRP